MSLQSLYYDIVQFWNNISPLVVAHILIGVFLFWVSKKSFSNLSEDTLRFFRSARYLEWKHVLSEFDLMSKMPLLIALALLIYLVILSSLLNLLTIGFSNPLTFVYSSDYWVSTNSKELNFYLVEIGSRQSETSISISEIISYRDQIANELMSKYPEDYRAVINWLNDYHAQWKKYYQISIVAFGVFIYMLLRAIKMKRKDLHYLRLIFAIFLTFISILGTRYVAEQYIEQADVAKMKFVMKIIQRDSLSYPQVLDNNDVYTLECQIYRERIRFQQSGNYGYFWLSRWFDGYLPREMTEKSPEPWEPVSLCP